MVSNQSNYNDFQRSISENIAKHGILVLGVCQSHSYSIGAKEAGCPDLYLENQVDNIAIDIINQVYQFMNSNNVDQSFYLKGLLESNNNIAVMKVSDENIEELHNVYMFQATNFYKSDDYEVFQIIMPDENGFFPWDKTYRGEEVDLKFNLSDINSSPTRNFF